jgi:ATP-dependent Clp protease ATP-binding subunit ClpA
MFERFTDPARRVVVRAQEEARALNHDYIGTEHILLGLVNEGEGAGAKTLESLGISLTSVRETIGAAVGKGQQATGGHIPFTPSAKHVLELSLRESLQLGCDYIGTEHILLGLLRESDSVAARALTGMGVDLARARQRVIQLLQNMPGGSPSDPSPFAGRGARGQLFEQSTVQLQALDRRLAAVEKWAGLDPDVAVLDEQITRLRRARRSAFTREDAQEAAILRDKESELLEQRSAKLQESLARPTFAEVVGQLRDEIARLRAILREHGIEPGDGA